ncbi:MAG: 2-oxoacid:acceptor oxidoreductase family protein, partial [Sedimentisphaerales bacterium]|nr:2-oxoacid:acceptor oxidoreductase family protein [Sedimentisphaerales bacterium]
LPAYGPEQRGGTSNCSVVISGQPVGSPAFINSDVLIALNAESLAKFSPEVKPGGIICYDASLKASDIPAGVKAIAIPALELSQQAGFARAANIFMLGIICSLDIYKIKKEHFLQSICDMFAGNTKLIAENHKIFDMAIAWAKTNLRQP